MRTLAGGNVGEGLTIAMYSATELTWAIGDLCALDTGANRSVKKPVNDTVPFGRVVAIGSGPNPSTSATSTILTIEPFGFTKLRTIVTNAAVDLGVSIQSNGTGNNVETKGDALGRTLVIADVTNADTTHSLDVLC